MEHRRRLPDGSITGTIGLHAWNIIREAKKNPNRKKAVGQGMEAVLFGLIAGAFLAPMGVFLIFRCAEAHARLVTWLAARAWATDAPRRMAL